MTSVGQRWLFIIGSGGDCGKLEMEQRTLSSRQLLLCECIDPVLKKIPSHKSRSLSEISELVLAGNQFKIGHGDQFCKSQLACRSLIQNA